MPMLPDTLASESIRPKTVFFARLPAPRAIPMPRSLLPFIMTESYGWIKKSATPDETLVNRPTGFLRE